MIDNSSPLHPGQVLAEIYMSQMGLSQSELARRCGCSQRKINEIVNGKRGISAAFAITLETVLGTSAEMWVRMQADPRHAMVAAAFAPVRHIHGPKAVSRIRSGKTL